IDTENPTVTVDIVASTLTDAQPNSDVTFVFSEAPTGFTAVDIDANGGVVSSLHQDMSDLSRRTYVATFTKSAGFFGMGSVSVNNESFTDVVGNLGSNGSDSVAVTTMTPTFTGTDNDDLFAVAMDNSSNVLVYQNSILVLQAPAGSITSIMIDGG